jgi:predicted permease
MFDFRLAARGFRRQAAVTWGVVLVLGLAVAVNTALFSVLYQALFRPLPFADVDRIVHLETRVEELVILPRFALELLRLEDKSTGPGLLTDQVRVVSEQVLYEGSEASVEWKLTPALVSAGMSSLLGVRPLIGRSFVEADGRANPRPVLLGYDLWRRHFGADRAIVDRIIDIPGTMRGWRWVVVGVMPQKFDFPRSSNFWVAVAGRSPNLPEVPTYAKLANGVTVAQVRRDLPHVSVTPLDEHLRPRGAVALALCLAGSGLFLIVAWVQVGSLLFARAAGRTVELAIRMALGGSRPRLFALLASEALLVSVGALGVALLTTPALSALIRYVLPGEITGAQEGGPDWHQFLFASGLAAAGFVSLAVLPAEIVRRSRSIDLLRTVGPAELRVGAVRTRTGLLAAQVVVSVVLLYATGLVFQSFQRLMEIDLGFTPDHLVAVRLPISDARSFEPEVDPNYAALKRESVGRIAALPGVGLVATASALPLEPAGLGLISLRSELDPQRGAINTRTGQISVNYPVVVQTRLLAGRTATHEELAATSMPPMGLGSALVTEALARRLAEFGPVVGQVVRDRSLRYRILGVIADLKTESPSQPSAPVLLTYYSPNVNGLVVLARLERDDVSTEASLGDTLQRLWGRRASGAVIRMETMVASAMVDYRARVVVLAMISLSSLVVVAVGIFGAVSYSSRQRAPEIAIRAALGASPREVRRFVVRQTMVVVGAAILIGLLLGLGVGLALQHLLFGVHAADPMTMIGVALVLGSIAWLASLVPAWRAGQVEPNQVLRGS